MSLVKIHQKALELATEHHKSHPIETFLDIGAGCGELVQLLRAKFGNKSSVCDYTDELMRIEDQKVDKADLNTEGLAYPDNTFDLVTTTEVIEHLEHYRETLREIFRVLKPGGLCVLSTPNILNINSRLRFIWFGYWNLFGPLPVRNSALYSTGGHINPVSYFYIAHSLMDAGFDDVRPHIDKPQRSGVFKLLFFWLPIKLFGARAWSREVNRFKTIDKDNAPIVKAMNSTDLLTGRTIITSSVKPKQVM